MAFGSLSWPVSGASGTQINITLATIAAITQGPYTIAALTKPKASRGATLSAKVSTNIQRELIIDSNALYGAGDFVGFPGMVAGDWHWIAQTKASGNQPYLSYRKDMTLGGSIVAGSTGAGLHGDFAAATSLALGQGDNESRDDHQIIAIWLRQLSQAELDALMTNDVKDVIAAAPDALWLANVSDPAALRDATGHGNNPSSVAGPGTIVPAADFTGFNWRTCFTDADMGSSETFDPATVAVEFTVPAGKAYRFRSFFPALAGTTPGFRLYDAGGTLLASGAFDSTTVDTWNWFTPSGGPISLAAGTYRVAQWVSRYRFVSAFLAAPVTRNGITANRGMFASGADAVPNTASTAWFGLDMEFIADSGPIVIQDGAGGVGAGGQADGRILGDSSGASGAAGTTDGRTLGDGSGGAGAGGTSDPVALGDGSGSTGSGGAGDGLALGDGSGGAGAGGSTGGTALGDASGGVGFGGSADTLALVPVIIQDASGGLGAGGSPDSISQVVHDTMVMPVLLSAMACLQGEADKTASPPTIYTVRPGDSFEASADPWIVECCAGVGWVRQVSSYETDVDSFPDPLTHAVSDGCPPDSMAVVVEIGISRCFPVAGDSRGSVVTTAQWMAASQQQADDGAALRRVLCCLRELYDNSDVVSGQVNPLPIQGGCGGVSAQVTIRRNACDC
jgi:hypothetical protein